MRFDVQVRERGKSEWLDFTKPGDVKTREEAEKMKAGLEIRYPGFEARVLETKILQPDDPYTGPMGIFTDYEGGET